MKKLFFPVFAGFCLIFCSCAEKDGRYFYSKADSFVNCGKFEKGIKAAQKAENLFNQDGYEWKKVVVLEGEGFLWMGKTKEAMAEFERAFEVNPEDEDTILNIVVTCVRCNFPQVAKEFCTKKLLSRKYSSKTEGLLYFYLANVAVAEKNHQEARSLLQKAQERFLRANITAYDGNIENLYRQIEEIQKMEKKAFVSIGMSEGLARMKQEKNFVLLDVRRPDEYKAGHIPGAKLLTNEIFTEQDAAKVIADKDQLVFVYCRSGRRSKEASQKLVDFGYTGVVEIGGILDYNGPVEK